MKLIKKIVVKIVQALIIFAMVYAVIDGFDRSTAFNDERVSQQRTSCRQARNVDLEGGIFNEKK